MNKTSTKVLISGFLLILFASICFSIYLYMQFNATISIGKGTILRWIQIQMALTTWKSMKIIL